MVVEAVPWCLSQRVDASCSRLARPSTWPNAQDLLSGLSEHERDQLGELLGKLLYTVEDPTPEDRLAPELGLVVDSAPIALEQRRAVGLPPLTGLLVRHVEPASPAAASGIRSGDLLRTADQRALRTRQDLHLAIGQSRRRQRALALEIVRGTESIRLRLASPGQ